MRDAPDTPQTAESTSSSRWVLLGRLLPSEIRERVFEPAYADLRYTFLTSRRPRGSFGLRVLGTWLGCIPIAVPRVIVRNGRLTRLGRGVLVGATVVTVYLVVVTQLYGPYTP